MMNTVRTTLGFVRSVIERRTPFAKRSRSLQQIYNYLEIDGLYATSGQPDEEQFAWIRDAGYEVVVNLAPNEWLENSLRDEAGLLRELGVEYVHIPVDFKDPTESDFTQFVATLEGNADRKIWVHCAANARVSAFTYRYRRAVLGVDADTARADLEKIWSPFGVWKRFIAK